MFLSVAPIDIQVRSAINEKISLFLKIPLGVFSLNKPPYSGFKKASVAFNNNFKDNVLNPDLCRLAIRISTNMATLINVYK